MAGPKNKCVVCVTDGLTDRQASQLISEIAKSKNRIAPHSRSTAAVTTRDGVGRILQKGFKQISGK